MREKILFLLFLLNVLFTAQLIQAQVTIGIADEPNKGALLDLKEDALGNSNKGLGLPRISLNALETTDPDLKVTIDGATGSSVWNKDEHIGLVVYNVNSVETETNRVCPGVHVWDGGFWQPLKPYAAPLEQKVLDTTQPLVRGFTYLDPSSPKDWPADKEADRLAGKYNLGHSVTNNTPDLEDIRGTENFTYTTSRFYVGYKTITGTYNVKYSYKCDPTATPEWVGDKSIIETQKNLVDGVWMTQNLRTRLMPDGTTIIKFAISNPSGTPEYQTINNESNTDDTYGTLYNWYASINVGLGVGQTPDPGDVHQFGGSQDDVYTQGICSKGWHLPSDQEWTDLENGIIRKTSVFSSVPDMGDMKMVSYDQMDWLGLDGLGRAMKSGVALFGGAATNGESNLASMGGFEAYLVGHFKADTSSPIPNPSYSINNAYFWSGSSFGATDAMRRSVYTEAPPQLNHEGAHRGWSARSDMFTIRCKKD